MLARKFVKNCGFKIHKDDVHHKSKQTSQASLYIGLEFALVLIEV